MKNYWLQKLQGNISLVRADAELLLEVWLSSPRQDLFGLSTVDIMIARMVERMKERIKCGKWHVVAEELTSFGLSEVGIARLTEYVWNTSVAEWHEVGRGRAFSPYAKAKNE